MAISKAIRSCYDNLITPRNTLEVVPTYDFIIPETYNGDSGIDLPFPTDITVPPGSNAILIDLGISCRMYSRSFINMIVGNKTYHGFYITPRSSISKTPLMLANSPGLIDSNYTGSIKVAVRNLGDSPFLIVKGTRLFQLVSTDLVKPFVRIVASHDITSRGGRGFGSTN